MKRFKFTFVADMEIKAEDITEAIEIFKKQPIRPLYIRSIESGGKKMGLAVSRETNEAIWYEPGCSCGTNDCLVDPMRKIAEDCAHQADMTPDKWESCSEPDPYDDNCYNYVRK